MLENGLFVISKYFWKMPKKVPRKANKMTGEMETIGGKLTQTNKAEVPVFLELTGASKSFLLNAALETAIPIFKRRMKSGHSWYKADPEPADPSHNPPEK